MNSDSVELFTAYFGTPADTHLAFVLFLFLAGGLTWIIIIIKAFKERGKDRTKDDVRVLWVILRGLCMLLLLIAFLMR